MKAEPLGGDVVQADFDLLPMLGHHGALARLGFAGTFSPVQVAMNCVSALMTADCPPANMRLYTERASGVAVWAAKKKSAVYYRILFGSHFPPP